MARERQTGKAPDARESARAVLAWCRPWYAHVREYPLSCAVALVALLFVATLPGTDFGERLELRTHGLRFRLRGPRETTAKVVIAAVDDSTEQAWVSRPSFLWTGYYAQIIDNARRHGAPVVGLDVIPSFRADDFLEEVGADTPDRPDTDLARAIQSAGGRVVLARQLTGDVQPIERFAFLPEAEGNIGFADLPRSPDDRVHKASLLHHLPGDDAPLASLPALLALRGSADRAPGAAGGASTDADRLRRVARMTGLAVTGGATGGSLETFWINYTGTDLPVVPAHHLQNPELLTEEERDLLPGAVVLVGFTFRMSKDWQSVPDGATAALPSGRYPQAVAGVVVQAQAVATLLDARPLLRFARWREHLLTLGVGALALALAVGLPFGRGLLMLCGLGTALFAGAALAFSRADLLLPLVAPLAALAAPWLVFHAARSVEENNRRLHREMMLGRYVSPQIRDYILADPAHARPGGTLQDATILFLDMRGSTVYGEKKDPVLLLNDLNEFFGVIVPVVDGNGGLLYRYTGDGFLAVFGAPSPVPPGLHGGDHARAAVAAAADLVNAVARASVGRERAGLFPWRIGCSVHSGPVAAGNLGTEDRPDFTVIGDTVNLCAKMEERNKAENSDIVVSETTIARLRVAAGVGGGAASDFSAALPPGLPAPFLSKRVRIGKRLEETPLHFFCVDAAAHRAAPPVPPNPTPAATFATAPAANGPAAGGSDQETRTR